MPRPDEGPAQRLTRKYQGQDLLLLRRLRQVEDQRDIRQIGMLLEQQLGNGAAEHGVAQEFKPFVVGRAEAAVRERLCEQRRLLEAVAKPLLEYRMAGHRRAAGAATPSRSL